LLTMFILELLIMGITSESLCNKTEKKFLTTLTNITNIALNPRLF
jgi:hypothetical protein